MRMSEQWEVFVAGHPRPQGSIALWTGRDGKERAKYASTTVAWRNTLHLHLSEWWAGRPALTGPVRAEMLFVLPRPKAHWSARGGLKPSAPMYHTQQYDLDKLVRAVDDERLDDLVRALWVLSESWWPFAELDDPDPDPEVGARLARAVLEPYLTGDAR